MTKKKAGYHRTSPPAPLPELPRAACRGESIELFFSPDVEPGEGMTYRAGPARRICMRCPERQSCLGYALDDSSLVGVWGGTTTAERAVMRSERAVSS